MDLRTSENFWPIKNGLYKTFPPLQKSLKTDVAIIGAGISGALMADELCKRGLEVVMLDKRHSGFGSTAASTALIQYEIDTPLRELIKLRGVDHAVRSYKLCVKAIEDLKKLAQRYPNACDFKLRPSFQYSSYKSHLKDHQKEEELRRLHHISETVWLSQGEIKEKFNLDKPGGIYSKDAAVLDPFQLTHNLIGGHDKKSLFPFENTEVTNIIHKRNGVILECDSGYKVEAKKLIIACGYESQKYLPKKIEIPKTTYAVVSNVQKEKTPWHKEALIWETASPYLYLRTTADHRILIGGKDTPGHNPKKRDQQLKEKGQVLKKSFSELYPDIPFEVDFSWAGIFCGTKDGLPYIGQIPERPHTYFSLGFGGNGITYSVIAAQMISDLLLGKKNENCSLFSFQR